jgi:hypothetical protein
MSLLFLQKKSSIFTSFTRFTPLRIQNAQKGKDALGIRLLRHPTGGAYPLFHS